MILEENENLRKKIKNANGESEEERLNNAKKFVMRDEAIIKEMVETIFMTDIKVKKVKNVVLNFEKEIEGYKQIANITAYINDDTFVCIKYFSSKTNKDKGLSYGLLVNYPFNLFKDEEEKKMFTKKLCTFIYRNTSKKLNFHILIDLYYSYIKNPKLPKAIIAELKSRIIVRSLM